MFSVNFKMIPLQERYLCTSFSVNLFSREIFSGFCVYMFLISRDKTDIILIKLYQCSNYTALWKTC